MSRRIQTIRKTGFTLVELLAAVALSAILMAGLLGVIKSIGRTNLSMKQAQQGRTGPPVLRQVVDLLEQDLRHASKMRYQDGRFEIEGLNGIDPNNLSPQHEPVRVIYESVVIDSKRWLIRRQTSILDTTNRNTQTQLVCTGIDHWHIGPTVANDSASDQNQNFDWMEVPDRVPVKLVSKGYSESGQDMVNTQNGNWRDSDKTYERIIVIR